MTLLGEDHQGQWAEEEDLTEGIPPLGVHTEAEVPDSMYSMEIIALMVVLHIPESADVEVAMGKIVLQFVDTIR